MSEYDADGICTASEAALEMAEKYVTVESGDEMADLMIGQYVFKMGALPQMNAVAELIRKIVATAIDEHTQQREHAAYERGKVEERARIVEALEKMREDHLEESRKPSTRTRFDIEKSHRQLAVAYGYIIDYLRNQTE